MRQCVRQQDSGKSARICDDKDCQWAKSTCGRKVEVVSTSLIWWHVSFSRNGLIVIANSLVCWDAVLLPCKMQKYLEARPIQLYESSCLTQRDVWQIKNKSTNQVSNMMLFQNNSTINLLGRERNVSNAIILTKTKTQINSRIVSTTSWKIRIQ